MTDGNRRQVRLRWLGEGLVFSGGPDEEREITIDGDGVRGQSPMEMLLLSLAGCMAIDVVMILEKGRVPVDDLEVEVVGRRAGSPPKRYEAIVLTYRLSGPSMEALPKVDRAIQLSRDKYCSVLHSLAPDTAIEIHLETS